MSVDIIGGIVAGSISMLLIALFSVILIIRYRQKQFQNRKEIVQLHAKFQHELLQAQLEIQEQTMKNISQEIHDNIGQTLSLAKLNLGTIDATSTSAAAEKITGAKDLVSKAIIDLRQLSKTLNADSVLSGGLVKAIESDLSIISKAGVFETHLEISGIPTRVDTKKELISFRIVQEAISNIIRHSKANRIEVAIVFKTTVLNIIISDNGKGFLPGDELSEGSGLRNMNNRAELIGGSLEVRSTPNGTCIKLTVPTE
jgi:two-component system, NarL family, sensor kinase